MARACNLVSACGKGAWAAVGVTLMDVIHWHLNPVFTLLLPGLPALLQMALNTYVCTCTTLLKLLYVHAQRPLCMYQALFNV